MVTASQVREILSNQDYKCALTGLPLDPSTAALDHKEARANGGSDDKENLHVVHKVINRMKGTLSTKEFIEWCGLAYEYHRVLGDE